MTSPDKTPDPKDIPILAEAAKWVIDLTDGAEPPYQKQFLRDATAVGQSWTDAEGRTNVPIGLHRKEADGSMTVLAAQSSQEDGDAKLVYVPIDKAYNA